MADKSKEHIPVDDKLSDERCVTPTPCVIDMEYVAKLKDSTKMILMMIEEIQRKTITKNAVKNAFAGDSLAILPHDLSIAVDLAADLPEDAPLRHLEEQIKDLEDIEVENDDCSIYKKLTRKCHCLNRPEYNDLVIHFNEDTKFSTSRMGEMIKNMNILKRFIYIGGDYTKNALMFMNEGLSKSTLIEKVDILTACSHADLCNVFNGDSIIKVCLAWPVKFTTSGDTVTQNLTARVLYRMASVEEGKRYLNFNSKTIVSLQRLLKANNKHFDEDTIEFIQAVIKLLSPAITIATNGTTCYHKADEDAANYILNTLSNFRHYLTVEEVKYHLNLLVQLIQTYLGKLQLWREINTFYITLKKLLLQYDDSEMNMILIKLLSKLLVKPLNKSELSSSLDKTCIVTDMATEPLEVKDGTSQIPTRPKNFKNIMSVIMGKAQSQTYRPPHEKLKKRAMLPNKFATYSARNFSNIQYKGKAMSTAGVVRLSRADQSIIKAPDNIKSKIGKK